MFCENCGERLPNDARFCTNCGHKVQVLAQPTQNFEIETNPQESALAEEVLAALQEEEKNSVKNSSVIEQEQALENAIESTAGTEQEQSEEKVTESTEEAEKAEQALLQSNAMKQSLSNDTWTPGVMQPQGNMYGLNGGEQISGGYNQEMASPYGVPANNGMQQNMNNGMPMNNSAQPNMNGMPMNNGVQSNMNGMPMNNGVPNQQWSQQQGFVPNGQAVNPQGAVPNEQPVHNKVKKKHKKLHILSKIAILEWVAVAALLVGSYMMGQKYFSAEQSAKQYFTALMSGKVSDAYQCIDVSADSMVNENNFKTVVAQQGCKKISGYDIVRDVEKNDHMHEITIRYNVKESTEDFYYTVCMEKTGEKKFYLFDQWKVNVGDVVAQKVKVTVPKGTKVSINGKELSKDWKKVQENEDCYTIPKMFYGTYEAKATHPIYEDETFTLCVDGEENIGELTGFSKVKDDVLQSVTEQAMNDFRVYWNGMTKKTGFAQLENLSQLSEDNYSSEDDYANMLSQMASSKTEGIVALTFDELNVKAVTVNDIEGQRVQVEFNSDMAYTYNTYDFWNEKLKMERRTDYYQGTINYVYEDGKWLQDTSDLGFYVY